ncbi:MAG: 5,10-methylene-tetrahydrofolate dehydrogenase/methenyl tetrahydrofolate cyclohydrolase [Massilia sp.]|jgi:methylenetetrahydrofolate dehydrogenase (NADP+)/methenyltetrahydrofolate cyclohydrolase|nr:5,10-methylene-tetrahydrofolate dehydrogenase/methenyl tetrahydrofolate cyclohydrolase [Massilia sp.]
MATNILDGKALGLELQAQLRIRVEQLVARGVRPALSVILVGEDAASRVYVRNKVAACERTGIRSEMLHYPGDIEPAVVLARIAELNADPDMHGILVQLPLPRQFDEQAVLAAISADKDVDGFHAENVGALNQGAPRFIPCTPYGVMKMLEKRAVELKGKEAVIVGRSNIVGKPMAALLLAKGATVTICHSQTADLAFHTRRADILVAAVGRPLMITGSMIKPGAVVIDVGINRMGDGRLCGDIDFDSVQPLASLITPVPGGVGPMTITMLLTNTVEAAGRRAAILADGSKCGQAR